MGNGCKALVSSVPPSALLVPYVFPTLLICAEICRPFDVIPVLMLVALIALVRMMTRRGSFHAVSSHLKTGSAGIHDLRDVLRDPVQSLAHGVRSPLVPESLAKSLARVYSAIILALIISISISIRISIIIIITIIIAIKLLLLLGSHPCIWLMPKTEQCRLAQGAQTRLALSAGNVYSCRTWADREETESMKTRLWFAAQSLQA